MSYEAHIKRKRKSAAPSGGQPSASKSILYGLCWTAVSAIVLLFGLSAIVYSTPDPGSIVLPAALAAAYISAFVGGLAAAWINRTDALACGIIIGGALFVFIILLSLIIPGGAASGISFWASAGLHVLVVVFSILGALSGVSLRESGKRRRPRRR